MNSNYATTSHGKIMLPISDHGVIKVENVYRLVSDKARFATLGHGVRSHTQVYTQLSRLEGNEHENGKKFWVVSCSLLFPSLASYNVASLLG